MHKKTGEQQAVQPKPNNSQLLHYRKLRVSLLPPVTNCCETAVKALFADGDPIAATKPSPLECLLI